MANDGIIQVPPDSTGKRVDGASLTVAGQVVFRQRVVLGDPSSSDRAAVVTTAGALQVVGTVNLSGTALCQVTGVVNISNTPSVVVAQGSNLIGAVSLAAGNSNIGLLDSISRTVVTAWATPQILDSISKSVNSVVTGVLDRTDNNSVRFGDSANAALRVNIVAGTAAGVSQIDGTTFSTDAAPMVPIGAVFSDSGIGQSVSASNAGALRMTAFRGLHVHNRTDGGANMDDSANQALRVNIVAGTAAGVSQVDDTTFSTRAAPFVPVGAVFSDAGTGLSLSASHAGALRMTGFRGLHVNLRDANGTEWNASNPLSVKVERQSATVATQIVAGSALIGAVSIGAGNSNIGFIDKISATVTVAGNVSVNATVNIACATPFTINNISATVTVTTANPWIIAQPSASHGPCMTVLSTSATAVIVAAPGAGHQVYVTMLAVTNGGTVNTSVHVGPSVSTSEVTMFLASAGGGFVMNFDPPWTLPGNEQLEAFVKPNSVGNCYFNVNFFVV